MIIMLRLLQIQTIAVAMQMRRKKKRAQNTLLHAVDIRAAKRTRRLPPVGEIIGIGDSEYYPRYLRLTPDILEDIMWRVGPLLQHG